MPDLFIYLSNYLLEKKIRNLKTRMNKSDLLFQIDAIINAKRAYRDKATEFVVNNPETFSYLIELVFENKKRASIKAAWVLELVCHENLELLIPHLDFFTENLNLIKEESALRPITKVCNFILNGDYYHPRSSKVIPILNERQANLLIENSFAWLIDDHKIATQVFAMDNLFILSKNAEWVAQELRLVLQKETTNKSAGYQAHARKILQQI